ncbi:emp24/gp25L/p24 family/GOLD-domain-containing protein [Boletus reticuloceps]|uniref:Emp24/gp25L/p24 family/GOLD-domain-containing protein n=1 Tax=Boletus reticuloceps TaxID=495285 RepID=A0A8I2YV89_9AGAM|nr:emp24/gp25L/p24 family/GOLD-domain-containing protein [Boletus reticuloceps]
MFPTALSLLLLFLLPFSNAIKFTLPPAKFPTDKCIWNAAHINALVIVTANVSPGPNQRIDIEIIDATPQRNVYLSKKDIKGETRLAVTAHAEDEIGVCFKNHLAPEVRTEMERNMTRTIDLDVDVGADAVDYNAIANQESLSGLETEMRKLEGVVKEIVDELNYLKKRKRNSPTRTSRRTSACKSLHGSRSSPRGSGCMADFPPTRLL